MTRKEFAKFLDLEEFDVLIASSTRLGRTHVLIDNRYESEDCVAVKFEHSIPDKPQIELKKRRFNILEAAEKQSPRAIRSEIL